MVLPAIRCEVAFEADPNAVSPSWTDISEFFRLSETTNAHRGRQYELDQIQPGACAFWLRNDDGRFTPDNIASPYHPYVIPGRNVRITAFWLGVTYVLFIGTVDSWNAGWPTRYADRNLVQVKATDTLKVLGRHQLRSQLVQETLALTLAPLAYYPLLEPGGSIAYGDVSGSTQPDLVPRAKGGKDGNVFSDAGRGITLPGDDGQAMSLWGIEAESEGMWATAVLNNTVSIGSAAGDAITVGIWLQPNSTTLQTTFFMRAIGVSQFGITNPGSGSSLRIEAHKNIAGPGFPGFSIFYAGVPLEVRPVVQFADNVPLFVVAVVSKPTTTTIRLDAYVNGELRGSASDAVATGWAVGTFAHFTVGADDSLGFINQIPVAFYAGSMGHAFMVNGALTAADIRKLYRVGTQGLPAESTAGRAQRIAGYTNTPIGSADVGLSNIGSQTLAGRSVTDVFAEIASVEAGLIFTDDGGDLASQSRGRRRNAVAAFELDASAGHVSDLDFSADDQLLVNDLTYIGAGGAAGRVVNQASINQFDRYLGQLDLPMSIPFEASQRAQGHVQVYGQPRPRTQTIELDPLANPSLFPVLLAATLSQRFDTVNLPPNAPAPTMSWVLERLQHVFTHTSWKVALQASPYDATPYFQLDHPVYGRLDAGNRIGW